MKRIGIVAMLAALACGGTEPSTNEAATGAQTSSPSDGGVLPDVSGFYTFNQYAPFLDLNQPDFIMLAGSMLLAQKGDQIDGVASLASTTPVGTIGVTYTEGRNWTGTIENVSFPDHETRAVVRLRDTGSDYLFVGVVDAAGNLLGGSDIERHGYCTKTYLAYGCDALRR